MSPRRIIILAVVGITALGAGVVAWSIVQSGPHPVSGGGEASDAARREYRGKFVGGDTSRDVRGGQEMKPRW